MLVALLTLTSLALLTAVGLTLARRLTTSQKPQNSVIDVVNATLPQTQCGQCNYPGCKPYATAIVEENAPINQCPPGGQATIVELAELLGREALPLNEKNGVEAPALIAYIHEDLCIGCKKCILACPVDAIVGAPKRMHTVIANECTGCDLCVEPCPVDCIDMIAPNVAIGNWRTPFPSSNGLAISHSHDDA